MDEGDAPAVGACSRRGVDQANPRRGEPRQGGLQIGDRNGDVMHPFAALGQVACDRAVRVRRLDELDPATPGAERRYLDGLIGPYPAARDLYVERSPISHVERFTRPLIVLQGSEDAIVPPSQSEMIVDALRAKGVPVAYLLFDGEQHGFRRAENVRRALDAELAFYARVLGFELPDQEGIEPVEVENL